MRLLKAVLQLSSPPPLGFKISATSSLNSYVFGFLAPQPDGEQIKERGPAQIPARTFAPMGFPPLPDAIPDIVNLV